MDPTDISNSDCRQHSTLKVTLCPRLRTIETISPSPFAILPAILTIHPTRATWEPPVHFDESRTTFHLNTHTIALRADAIGPHSSLGEIIWDLGQAPRLRDAAESTSAYYVSRMRDIVNERLLSREEDVSRRLQDAGILSAWSMLHAGIQDGIAYARFEQPWGSCTVSINGLAPGRTKVDIICSGDSPDSEPVHLALDGLQALSNHVESAWRTYLYAMEEAKTTVMAETADHPIHLEIRISEDEES